MRPFRPLAPEVSIPRAAFVSFLLRSSSYGGHALALGSVVSALQAGDLSAGDLSAGDPTKGRSDKGTGHFSRSGQAPP